VDDGRGLRGDGALAAGDVPDADEGADDEGREREPERADAAVLAVVAVKLPGDGDGDAAGGGGRHGVTHGSVVGVVTVARIAVEPDPAAEPHSVCVRASRGSRTASHPHTMAALPSPGR